MQTQARSGASVTPATRPSADTDMNDESVSIDSTSASESTAATAQPLIESPVRGDTPLTSAVNKVVRFSSAARSVISQRKLQQHQLQATIPEDSEAASQSDTRAPPLATAHDPWSSVLQNVARKVGAVQPSEPRTARISLVHVLKSSGVKNLVKQAVATRRRTRSSAPPTSSTSSGLSTLSSSEPRSAVMEHWVKTAMLRHQTDVDFGDDDVADNDEDEDDDVARGIKSGFDVRASKSRQMYGRTLLLEESCRRAFAQSGENRSQMDLQALKAWFQMTKLKITTDFDRLQPAELDLLCRRMVLQAFHPKEVIFRQGDEGDALYLVFAGVVEVRVGQRILGEKVEVTVCELSKGDYFGERSLLNNEVRAATVLAKTPAELVRISRKDYNIMLKNDQLAFLSRMQMANGMVIPPSVQQSQREYMRVLMKKQSARTKSDIDMLSAYLQTLKFFRALPKTFVRELCTVVDVLKLPAGTPVFREGEVGDLFYIIFSGSVDVIVSSQDARGQAQQTKLINLTEGAHFGELALMKGHGIRSATVMTREECRFLVICEKDYNATLRRMQKEDLAKRVGVLDQIPIFQTPEWTGEMLKEMSYVLSEQKLAAGHVLFQQGDKALQVFFVVRGELVVTKEIVDPTSHEVHTAFVERIGRYRVVGDDAAAGATFNEILFRQVSVTASTPVEVLVLSKYDVFHRLSRAAREALRTAAHGHEESVVDLDRFHKTDKWSKYKQRVLHEHMKHDRLAKILVQSPRSSNASDRPERAEQPKTKAKRKPHKVAPTEAFVPELAAASTNQETHSHHFSPPDETLTSTTLDSGIPPVKSLLVSANEFLLLPPHGTATARARASTRTIGHFVSTFNADAPPSQARRTQLDDVLHAERARHVHVLNEGNPLAYFDLQAIKQQEKKHHSEARGRAASTRRTLLIGASPLANAPASSPMLSPSSLDSLAPALATTNELAHKVAANVLNQLAHENFVFSRPVRLGASDDDADALARGHHGSHHHRKDCSSDEDSASAALKAEAEQLCNGDFVVVSITAASSGNDSSDSAAKRDGTVSSVRSLQSPLIQVLAAVTSLAHAREVTLREQTNDALTRRASSSISNATSELGAVPATTTFFIVPKRKYAVLPRANRPRAIEEQLQRELLERFGRAATAPSASSSSSSTGPSLHSRRPSPVGLLGSGTPLTNNSFPERAIATASTAASVLEPSGLFASFQKIVLTTSELREITSAHDAAEHESTADSAGAETTAAVATEPLPQQHQVTRPRLFAVASLVLSKHEIENSVCEEPFMCVHQLFTSEAQAMDAALHMTTQHFRNALFCVLPVGERVHLEDAYDWCVQVESDRRERRSASHASTALSPNRTKAQQAVPHPPSSPSRMAMRRTNSKASGTVVNASPLRIHTAGAAATPHGNAEWQIEREKAHRLHQFICSRLGQRAAADRERREQQEASGFTPKPLLTLEDKLATLHEYLESANAAAASARSGGNGNGSLALGKYRQMKRFGSIMRARINSTLATSGLSPSLLTSSSPSGTSPTNLPSSLSSSGAPASSPLAVSTVP